MDIERFSPLHGMLVLRDSFNRLIDEALLRPGGEFFSALRIDPALDMYETAWAVKVAVPLPGVKPDAVKIVVQDHTLTITGERRYDEERNVAHYYRHELHDGVFSRMVALPPSADTEQVEAALVNGMLIITFPKTGNVQSKPVTSRP